MRALALMLPFLLLGCPKTEDTDPNIETDTDTDTDTDADADTDSDTDSDADTDSGDSGPVGDSGDSTPVIDSGATSGSAGNTGLCLDDNLEDNDDTTTASTGVTNTTGLESIDGDDDYFEIVVPDGGIVEVEIFFIDAQGDIDLQLLDDAGNTLAGSGSTSDNEFVTFTNNTGAPTTWYGRVYMWTNGGCNTYDIEIRVGTLGAEICDDLFDNDEDGGADCDDYECIGEPACLQACPNEDTYETNDDQSDATVGFTSDIDLMVHPQNEDWFEIVVPHGLLAEATLEHDPTLGRVDLYLVDPAGNTLASDTSSDPTKLLRSVNTTGAPETWYARVATSGSCNSYDLTLTTGPIPVEDCGDTIDNDLDGFSDCADYDCLTDLACPNACPAEDAYEDNDNIGTATTGAGSETDLMVHTQDEDFYELVVGPGEIGRVDLQTVYTNGDIDLQLLDSNGDVVDSSGTSSNTESVYVVNDGTTTETYYARVFVWSGSTSDCNTYDMELYTGILPDEDCTDTVDNDLDGKDDCADYDCIDDAACIAVCAPEDAVEDNDTLATALPLGTGPYTIHAEDDDWFVIDVPDGEQVIFDLSHDHTIASVDLRLYDASGAVLDSDLSVTTDDKQVSGVNSTGATASYYAEVVHWNGAPCNTYTLVAAVAPVPDEICDDNTDNDLDAFSDCNDYDCTGDVACAGVCPAEDIYGGVNADPSVALPLTTAPDMSTHTQRPDWFRVSIPSDEIATIDVTFIHADGNIRVDVYDSDSVLLQSVDTLSDNEQLLIINDSPDTNEFLVKVSMGGTSDVCNSFDWAYVAAPLPDEVCDDSTDNDLDSFVDCMDYDCGTSFAACNCPAEDLYEPNDTAPTATTGLAGETGLAVFAQSPDFYAYTVPDGGSIDILVTYLAADGDVDFTLRNDAGTTLIQGFTSSDNEMGTWNNNTGAPVDVTLDIHLWAGANDACATYDLAVTVAP